MVDDWAANVVYSPVVVDWTTDGEDSTVVDGCVANSVECPGVIDWVTVAVDSILVYI